MSSNGIDLTLAAIRFTDDVPAMCRFLEALGLSTVETRGEGWARLTSRGGEVWLHSAADSDLGAPAGSTALTGEVAAVDATTQALETAGITVSVVDEAYGRSLEVTDPQGDILVLQESSADGYGYDREAGAPDPRVSLDAVHYCDPQGPYAQFAQDLGLHRIGEANEWFVPYSAGRGSLGLHRPGSADDVAGLNGRTAAQLGLFSSAPLAELQERLRTAGFDAGTIVTESFGDRIETTDPDGCHLEIHQAPRES